MYFDIDCSSLMLGKWKNKTGKGLNDFYAALEVLDNVFMNL